MNPYSRIFTHFDLFNDPAISSLLFEYAIGHLIDQDNAAAKAHESALLPSDAWVLFIAKDQDSMQQALDQEWTDIGYETGLETDSGDPNGGPGWRERRKWMQRIRMW